MRIARILVVLFFLPTCFSLQAANAQSTKKLSVTGKLTRAMAIGGESTGWSIQFDSETTIDNKPLLSIEVEGPSDQFQKLENTRVRAKGKLTHKHGVETGDRIVLRVSSMKEIKPE